MHRLVVCAGGSEKVFRTEMGQDEFDRRLANVENGNVPFIRLMDEDGATVCVNPSQVGYMRFEGWDDRR